MFKRISAWWEGLCRQCGECCYEKGLTENNLIFIDLDSPCAFLDRCSNRCQVYDFRFKVNKECRKVNFFRALLNPYLPDSCGYVKKVRFWRK